VYDISDFIVERQELLAIEGLVKTQTTNYETVDAAFAVDRGGAIVLWNSSAEKMFDYSATEALGQR
jgi:PAS domain-containing protein